MQVRWSVVKYNLIVGTHTVSSHPAQRAVVLMYCYALANHQLTATAAVIPTVHTDLERSKVSATNRPHTSCTSMSMT